MTNRTSTTVAIPMHASCPFVDVISANIAALPEDVEIILSDHTRVDDAIERLHGRHADDPRVRFVAASDGIGIVDHYNRLLREARGEYFMWMPHDDTFAPEYVPLLRTALDANPSANLAFGRLRPIGLDGETLLDKLNACAEPPIELGRLPRVDEAIYLWQYWGIWIPYRGLMRRREVLRRKLFLRHGPREHWHDQTWVFAMTVLAPIVFVPECACDKRFHLTSHHVSMGARRAVDELWEIITVVRYMIAARAPFPDASKAVAYAGRRSFLRASGHLPAGVRAVCPDSVRRAAHALLEPRRLAE
jgi:hypothetical protein